MRQDQWIKSSVRCRCTHHEFLDQATVISSRASSRTCLWHLHNVLPRVKLRASSRSPMETMDQAQSPNDDASTRTSLHETKEHTLFASFNASSHKPLAMYALLRLMKRPCGAAGLRDRATEYWEIATPCCSALIAVSPRPSSFPEQMTFNIHPHGMGDYSPRAHCTSSSGAFACSTISSTIWRKHSLASVMRSIVSRYSHMIR